jgi:hypothetical protein
MKRVHSIQCGFLPPFIFPQGGKVLFLPPWGKARMGVLYEQRKIKSSKFYKLLHALQKITQPKTIIY